MAKSDREYSDPDAWRVVNERKVLMNENKKPLFYYCEIHKNQFKGKTCPRCGRPGKPVMDVPFERDWSRDASYLDYISKGKKETE